MKEISTLLINEDADLPVYSTKGAAGADLSSTIDMELKPGQTAVIPTGLIVEIPENYVMLIVPRSGLSAKTGLRLPNSPGIIDSDYRGEVGIIIQNTAPTPYTIKKHDRIAQALIVKAEQANFVLTEEVSDTERGDGGFGSTGK